MPKLKASQFCKIDFAHTFKLESVTVMSFENHDIGRLVKYNCLILEKNANYRTPLKNSLGRTSFWLHFCYRMWKIEAPLTKDNSY